MPQCLQCPQQAFTTGAEEENATIDCPASIKTSSAATTCRINFTSNPYHTIGQTRMVFKTARWK
jgi:hypothetical protein